VAKPKRKDVTLLVTITVPGAALPSDTRSILRLAIANGLELNKAHTNRMRLKGVRPAGRIIQAAKEAWAAWGGGPKVRAPKAALPLIDYLEGRN